jgi:hypothetical protein
MAVLVPHHHHTSHYKKIGGEIMPWKYYPIHVTHIVVGLIWAAALVSINAIEFIYFKNIDNTGLFYVVLQNVGIGLGNAYWLARTHISPTGIDIQTAAK